MALRHTRFCRTGLRAFYRTSLWARGCPSDGPIYVCGNKTGTASLWKLDPTDGTTLATGAPSTDSSGVTILHMTQSGRLYGDLSTTLAEFNVDTLATANTFAQVSSGRPVLATGGEFVYTSISSTTVNLFAKVNADLDDPEVWEAGNSLNAGRLCVDSDGNMYAARNQTNVADGIRSLDSDGGARWTVTAGASQNFGNAGEPFAPSGDYFYCFFFDNVSTTKENYIHKRKKSDGSLVSSYTWHTGGIGTGGNITGDGTTIYVAAERNTTTGYSVAKIRTSDMSRIDEFDTGARTEGCMTMANGDLIVGGQQSTTWTGSGGATANVWRLDSNLDVVWSAYAGSAFFINDVVTRYMPR